MTEVTRNKKLQKIKEELEPFKGISWFLVLLFFFHYLWVFSVDGYMEGDNMYIFGKECTPDWFDAVSLWFAKAAEWFVRLFPGNEDFIRDGRILFFPDGNIRTIIVWGCTGIKQTFIFTGIMLFYRGPLLKKLWYIPLGVIILTIYNIIRIGMISILTNGHPERFEFLHDGVFRVIYYAIIFALWLVWEELIINKRNKNGNNQSQNPGVASGNA